MMQEVVTQMKLGIDVTTMGVNGSVLRQSIFWGE